MVVRAMVRILERARRGKKARGTLARRNRASRLDPGRPQWSCDRPWRRRDRAHLPAAGVNGDAGPDGSGGCRVYGVLVSLKLCVKLVSKLERRKNEAQVRPKRELVIVSKSTKRRCSRERRTIQERNNSRDKMLARTKCEMRTGNTARETLGGQGVLGAAVGNIMMCVAPVFRSPNWRIGGCLLGFFPWLGSFPRIGSFLIFVSVSLCGPRDGKSDRA